MTAYLAPILEGLRAPRRSTERVLSTDPGLEATLGLVLVAYLVQALVSVALANPRGAGEVGIVPWHISGLFTHALLFLLLSGLVFGVGRLFGGTGTLDRSITAVAWYSYVTSWLSPLGVVAFLGLGEEGNAWELLSLVLLIGVAGIGVVVFAGAVAAVHGFRSVRMVLATTLGLALGASVLISLVVSPPG
ncbi:MAG: YIP1 family protein [Pseudomonadota bacterium]